MIASEIGTSMFVRRSASACERRREEGTTGINNGRQGDQGGEPVQQRPGGLAHIGARPDRDREQHDVAGGEAGNRHGAQQLFFGQCIGRAERRGIIGSGRIAKLIEGRDHLVTDVGRADHRQPAGGEVEARSLDARQTADLALDFLETTAAMDIVNHQIQLGPTGTGRHADSVGWLGKRLGAAWL